MAQISEQKLQFDKIKTALKQPNRYSKISATNLSHICYNGCNINNF